jgi:hypothetical protein
MVFLKSNAVGPRSEATGASFSGLNVCCQLCNAAGPRSEATGASFSGLNVCCQLCFFLMVFLKSNAAGPRSEATGASFSGLNVCCQLCFFRNRFDGKEQACPYPHVCTVMHLCVDNCVCAESSMFVQKARDVVVPLGNDLKNTIRVLQREDALLPRGAGMPLSSRLHRDAPVC